MNATKRKFASLLQGLNTYSDPPMSGPRISGVSNDALLQKRRRLGFPESTAPKFSDASPIKPVLRRPTSKPPHSHAKYCPGDRDELLRRLATFQEITDWTPKPDKVNELEWAKRGWVCQGKEKVRCVLCHKELVVKLNRKNEGGKEVPVLVASEIESALVDKYLDLIVSSHQQDCLWKKRGCEDSLLRVSFSNAATTMTALRQRYDELCTRSAFLPYDFNLRLPFNLDDVIASLPPTFDSPPNKTALALALTGWQGLTNTRIGAVPNTASCSACLRRLALWMFKSKEVDDNGQVLVPAPMDHLDPVREHRVFCPWKNADIQVRGEEKQTAWESLAQMVKNEAGLRLVYQEKPKEAPEADPAQEDEVREAKDKERWARLRKVKSLFDTKGARRRRPGTSHSSRSGHE